MGVTFEHKVKHNIMVELYCCLASRAKYFAAVGYLFCIDCSFQCSKMLDAH
jgi:hypothetical protein